MVKTVKKSCHRRLPSLEWIYSSLYNSDLHYEVLLAYWQLEQLGALVFSKGRFMAQTDSTLRIGDTVDVRKHGRARIIDGPCLEPSNTFFGRYRCARCTCIRKQAQTRFASNVTCTKACAFVCWSPHCKYRHTPRSFRISAYPCTVDKV
jgi:hypothetical protein